MKRSKLALSKAIESGDTDLVFTVLLHLKNELNRGETEDGRLFAGGLRAPGARHGCSQRVQVPPRGQEAAALALSLWATS